MKESIKFKYEISHHKEAIVAVLMVPKSDLISPVLSTLQAPTTF